MTSSSKTKLPSALVEEAIGAAEGQMLRIKSDDLLQQMREIEIDHEGRIYRLRITQHNKLILTA